MKCDVLFIDDEPDIGRVMVQTLQLADLRVKCFDHPEAALANLRSDFQGVVLCDYHMPSMSGLEVMAHIHRIDQTIPTIILTGHGDISTAVNAMQQGAYDFIEKPFNSEELVELLRRALERRQLTLENRFLKNQLSQVDYPGPRLLGSSAAMQNLLTAVDQVAQTHADILIRGETGTGKDALARYIHERSPRRHERFLAINCAAIPENLIESELFGHVAGAFTGADRKRVGRFEYAHRGTVFLDELESMPMPLQVKLLRVLEERQVERLGSNQLINIDIRVIAATKSDLNEMTAAGTFRSDLYYRLNVLELDIPPLRERLDDVPLLFQHFVLIAADVHGREINPLQPEQIAQLQQHRWPGNVRELRNLAERYVLMGSSVLNAPSSALATTTTTLTDAVSAYERALIENALRVCEGSIKLTMDYLGLPRKTLSDKMRKYDLDKTVYRD